MYLSFPSSLVPDRRFAPLLESRFGHPLLYGAANLAVGNAVLLVIVDVVSENLCSGQKQSGAERARSSIGCPCSPSEAIHRSSPHDLCTRFAKTGVVKVSKSHHGGVGGDTGDKRPM